MTVKEERNLLEGFFERAGKGEIVTVKQIKQVYEHKMGHEVDETIIYRLPTNTEMMNIFLKQVSEDFPRILFSCRLIKQAGIAQEIWLSQTIFVSFRNLRTVPS